MIWGKYHLSFDLGEPKAGVQGLDAGHFALDTAADQIAQLARDFVK